MRLFLLALHSTLVLWHNAFGPHAHRQALLQPALLTLAPHVHVDLAIVPIFTLVHRVLRDASPEKSLAALAGQGVVVVAGRPIAADEAELLLLPWRRSLLLPGVAGVAAATSTASSASASAVSIAVQRARLRQLVPTCKTEMSSHVRMNTPPLHTLDCKIYDLGELFSGLSLVIDDGRGFY